MPDFGQLPRRAAVAPRCPGFRGAAAPPGPPIAAAGISFFLGSIQNSTIFFGIKPFLSLIFAS